MIEPWFSAGLVALAAIVGALLPWTRRWSSEGMHRLVALSAGIFLGTVLHMAGDLLVDDGEHDHGAAAVGHEDHAGHEHGDDPHVESPLFARPEPVADAASAGRKDSGADPVGTWSGVLLGFVGLALLERFVLRRSLPHVHGHDSKHALLWRASLVGLAIHSVFEGFALAGLRGSVAWEGALLFALLHKLVETFSLSTILRLAGLRGVVAARWLLGFSFIAPVAFIAGRWLLDVVEPWQPYAVAVAIGTFLYVTVFDLLPEAFHRGSSRDRMPYLLFGLVLGGFIPGLSHGHGNTVLDASVAVFVEMSPYLLFGFLVAGFVQQLLNPVALRRHLAGERVRTVALASIIGAPLPLCSCSVVPVAASLRAAGAGRGATSSFLVATPETGVDSVAMTYALLGPVMAIARPIAAIASAFVTGLAVSWFGGRDEDGAAERSTDTAPVWSAGPVPTAGHEHEHGHMHGHDHANDHAHGHAHTSPLTPPSAADSCCHSEPAPSPAPSQSTTRASGLVTRALRYAFVELVDDLAWPLVLGVALSGVLGAFIEPQWLARPELQGPIGYLVMLAIGLPIYVCAAASTPIAAVLIAKGLSPGAVLVFLLASPATNLGSLVVVKRLLGARGLLVHLVTLSVVTLVCGVAADLVFGALGLEVVARVTDPEHTHGLGDFAWISAVLLVLVLVASSVRKLGAPLGLPSTRVA